MDDIDKYIPVSCDFFNLIRTLIGGIEVDLDAPLPTEEVYEEEYRAALVEGEKLMVRVLANMNTRTGSW